MITVSAGVAGRSPALGTVRVGIAVPPVEPDPEIVSLLVAASASDLSPTKDTWTNAAAATTANGGGSTLSLAGATSATPGYVLMSFDLSALPAATVVNQAALTMVTTSTNASARDYELYILNSGNADWVEASATYNTKNGTDAWLGGSSGGGTATTDHATPVVGEWSYAGSAASGTVYRVMLDPQTVAQHAGGTLNLLIKRLGTTTSTSPTYGSRTNGTVGNRPTLDIDYEAFRDPVTADAIPTFVGGATTYYVATTGNDSTGDGTSGTPWASIGYGRSQLTAGDTLLVRGGTYTEFIDESKHPTQDGTAAQPIIVMAYPGETVTLRGIYRCAGDYWVHVGINMQWYGGGAISGTRSTGTGYTATPTTSDHMIVLTGTGQQWLASEVKDWLSFAGILLDDGAVGARIAYCTIHNGPTGAESGHTSDQDHGIYISGGKETIVERTAIYDIPNGRCIKIGPSAGDRDTFLPEDNIIRYSTLISALGGSVGVSYRAQNNLVERCIMGVINDSNADGIGSDAALAIFHLGEAGAGAGLGTGNTYSNNLIYGGGITDADGTNSSVTNWVDGGGNDTTGTATANYPGFLDATGPNLQVLPTSAAIGYGRWAV